MMMIVLRTAENYNNCIVPCRFPSQPKTTQYVSKKPNKINHNLRK